MQAGRIQTNTDKHSNIDRMSQGPKTEKASISTQWTHLLRVLANKCFYPNMLQKVMSTNFAQEKEYNMKRDYNR